MQNKINILKPHIVCLTETKLNDEVSSTEIFDTEQYAVYRKDRVLQNAPGGGVAILVRKCLLSSDTNVKLLNEHDYGEAV